MVPANVRVWGAVFLLLLGNGVLSAADDTTPEQQTDPEQREQHSYATVGAGYRFISPDGATARANPYGVNRSGVTAQFGVGTLGPDLKLRTDGHFFDDDDYQGELFFDYSGILRAELETRSLYHNLVRRPLFPGFTSSAAPQATYRSIPSDDGAGLGIASRQDRVDTRVRLGRLPGHLSLGYWRFNQTGSDQLVVADFEPRRPQPPDTGPNTFYDVTRRVDQVTQEGRIALDANLGPVSLAYTFKIRDFSNNAPLLSLASYPVAVAAPAEGRVTAHRITLYSNLSGGLTAAAAYSITQRENTSRRSDLIRSSQPRDTIQQVAGDLTYTPFRELTLVLKYRRRQMDRETPELVTSLYSTAVSRVRPATSSTRDTITLASSWRPAQQVTLMGEYRADLLSRENVWLPMTTSSASQPLLSDASLLQTGTLTLLWRPWLTTRMHASYSYAGNSQPTTLNDFSDRHTGALLLDWNSSSGRWGITTHYRATAEQNPVTVSTVWDRSGATMVTPRDGLTQSAGAGIWFSPLSRLTVTATYGCIAIDTREAMLLTAAAGSSLATRYSSIGHLYGLDAVYAAGDRLDLSASLQQVRSTAAFTLPAPGTMVGSFNRLNAIESSASTRLDWRFARYFGWMLEYRFSAYRSDDSQYNGDIHSTTVALSARW